MERTGTDGNIKQVASCRLTPPISWIDEVAISAASISPSPAVLEDLGDIVLSYTPKAAEKWPVPPSEVGADLSRGLVVTSGRLSPGMKVPDRYCIEGSEFRVLVCARNGKKTSASIALIIAVDRLAQAPVRDFEPKAQVSLAPVWDEKNCDLPDLMSLYRRSKASFRRAEDHRRGLRTAATNTLSCPAGDEETERSTHLNRILLKRYGALQAMLRILEMRSTVEGNAEMCGEVEANGAQDPNGESEETVSVKVVGVPDCVEIGTRIRIQKENRESTVERITAIEGNRLVFERPEVMLAAGEKLSLRVLPRFAMQRHVEALERLFDGNVEGDWQKMVELLCSSDQLPPPSQEEMDSLSADIRAKDEGRTNTKSPLNDEQVRAVAGAVTAPHAFFIQGPPGTGKTTVISEIVWRLCKKGERVLLLAPTHVAVDEVLRRIQKGGARYQDVFPLRLAFDESKVSEDVQCFTESVVQEETVARLKSVKGSRALDWENAAKDLRPRCHAFQAWSRLCEETLKEENELIRQKQELDAARERHETTLSNLDHKVAECRKNIAGQAEESKRLSNAKDRQLAQIASARSRKSLVRTFFSEIGGELSRLQDQLADVESKQRQANGSLGHWTKECNSVIKERTELVNREAPNLQKLEGHFARHTAEVDAVRRKMLAARTSLVEGDQIGDNILMARGQAMAGRLAKLEHYERLERRWFEITRLDQADDGEARQCLGANVIDFINLFCATTTGIAGSQRFKDITFDTLIIDEASRVTDSEFLIGAVRARRWILVGDEHQLPPYVEPEDEYFLHALNALHRMEAHDGTTLDQAVGELAAIWDEEVELHQFRETAVARSAVHLLETGLWAKSYKVFFARQHSHLSREGNQPDRQLLVGMRDFLVRSLFERCVVDCAPELRQRLVIQRRMIPSMAEIVREPVYGGEYQSPDISDLAQCGIVPMGIPLFDGKPIIFLDTSLQGRNGMDKMVRNGFVNELEVDWVIQLCRDYDRELASANKTTRSISILSFYRAQAMAIRQRLNWPHPRGFRCLEFRVVDAIDKIQGQESDLVIVSFCRAKCGGRVSPQYGQWLQDLRRLNVACTRARCGLIMVGHKQTLQSLCAMSEATAFYKNLFGILEKDHENTKIIKDYAGRDGRHHA